MRPLILAVLALLTLTLIGCGGGGLACVREGTLIGTPSGDIAIEKLKRGDQVWRVDSTGKREVGTVVNIQSGSTRELVRIFEVGGSAIVEATPNHFIATPKGWAQAWALNESTRVISGKGEEVAVKTLAIKTAAKVYDLLVSPGENYIAGGILVHNKSVAPPAQAAECTGAFGFFSPDHTYKQVTLSPDGTGICQSWEILVESASSPPPVEQAVEWGVEGRTMEIVAKGSQDTEAWQFEGTVAADGLDGELIIASNRSSIVMLRPAILSKLVAAGGIPATPPPQKLDYESLHKGDWQPKRPSRK